MRSRLAVAVSLVLVTLASMISLGVLNAVYFENFLIETYDGRLLATAADLRSIFAQALTSGLPLRQLGNGRDLVQSAESSIPDLRRVAVYDRVGDRFQALYGAKSGNPLPKSWERAMQREATAPFWPIKSEEGFGVLLPVYDIFDRVVALIALIHATEQVSDSEQVFNTSFLRVSLAVTVPVLLLLIPGALWAVRPAVRRLPQWSHYVAEAAARRAAGQDPPPLPAPISDEARTDVLAGLLRAPFAALGAADPARDGDAAASVSAERLLRRVRQRVLGVAVAGILAAGAGSTIWVAGQQTAELPQVLAEKDVTVAGILGAEIGHAIDLGIPLDKLRGMDVLLDGVRKDHPEIGYLLLCDASGRRLAVSGAALDPVSLADVAPTLSGAAPLLREAGGYSTLAVPLHSSAQDHGGTIYVGIDAGHIRRLVRDRIFDVLTVLVVTVIIAIELQLMLLELSIVSPLRSLAEWGGTVLAGRADPVRGALAGGEFGALLRNANAAALGGARPALDAIPWQVMIRFIRVALFLFVLGDTLCVPLLPLFAREVTEPVLGLSKQFLLSLPVVVYWLASAIVQLFGVRLMERTTHRMAFMVGAVCAMAGFGLAATVHGTLGLLLARTLSGIGLGTVFMTCQAAILTHVPAQSRTQGVATFTGAFFLATFCGNALGGVAAQQLGFRGAFLLSAGVVLLSAVFALAAFGQSREVPANRPARSRGYAALGRNPRFTSLLLLCAVPNRTYNVVLLFYLAPLYLYALGSSKPEIGRAVCLYGIAMAVAAPALAGWVDGRRWQVHSVVGGSLLCAAGAFMVLSGSSFGVMLAILLMGLGQALSVPSQMSLVPVLAANESSVIGMPRVFSVFRVGERLPAFLGPMVAQILVGLFGYTSVIVGFGVWVGVSALALAGVLYGTGTGVQWLRRS